MKNILFIISILFAMPIIADAKGTITKTIEVKGNCGECKDRIEEAAYTVSGVKKATWNKKTKQFTVVFNSAKTNIDSIAIAIAKIGHDANGVKADSTVYNSLPGCCQYRDGKCKNE
jgi:copper chaperone CopZ